MISYGLVFGVVTMLLFGVSGFLIKKPISKFGNAYSSFIILLTGEIPLALAVPFFIQQFNVYIIVMGAISSVPMALGYIFFYASLQKKQASNTFSINVLQAVIIAVGGVALLGETLKPIEIVGFIAGVIGVFFVTTHNRINFDRSYLPAVVGNVLWAIYWVFLGFSVSHYGGLIPTLFIGRTISVFFTLPLYFSNRNKIHTINHKNNENLGILLLIGGVLAGIGNIAFSLLILFNFLAAGSIFNALSLVIIILLSFAFLKERFTLIQTIGIITAVIGGLLIAVA
ncbi:MAG: DMT family transporter [Candidatus Parvarchaeota archaeon]|nr:DMT family transporter [Candidatus Parvarchaeota archaeon]MCL5101557.1 DMT family transporter [Candidatus Parvarchaeota archaeon]